MKSLPRKEKLPFVNETIDRSPSHVSYFGSDLPVTDNGRLYRGDVNINKGNIVFKNR